MTEALISPIVVCAFFRWFRKDLNRKAPHGVQQNSTAHNLPSAGKRPSRPVSYPERVTSSSPTAIRLSTHTLLRRGASSCEIVFTSTVVGKPAALGPPGYCRTLAEPSIEKLCARSSNTLQCTIATAPPYVLNVFLFSPPILLSSAEQTYAKKGFRSTFAYLL